MPIVWSSQYRTYDLAHLLTAGKGPKILATFSGLCATPFELLKSWS